jgi:POT family proton-dependent oligopeptide transporter
LSQINPPVDEPFGNAIRAGQDGHPPGLFLLFFVEMWERFSFYGMRALLTFYLIKGFLKADDKEAYAIYGAYGALVYATPYLGGIFADRFLGARLAVIFGGCLMAAGHLLMSIEQDWALFGALGLLIVGNGFFKPNISTMVGSLYPQGSSKRDAGFTIFYMGINLGAALAPLVCGYIGETYGWHYGFGLATIGMLLGIATFVAPGAVARGLILLTSAAIVVTMFWTTRSDTTQMLLNIPIAIALLGAGAVSFVKLGTGTIPADMGLPRDEFGRVTKPKMVFPIMLGTIAAVAPLALLVKNHGYAGWALNVIGILAFGSIFLTALRSNALERGRLFVILILCFFSMLFWAFFEQGGSSVNNFTDRNVDRVSGGIAVVEGQTYSDVAVTQEFLGVEVAGKVWTLADIEAAQKAAVENKPEGRVTFTATKDQVDKGLEIGGNEIKASVFQAANPTFILLLGPVFSWLWGALGRRDPNPGVKFGLGLAQCGLGFGCFWVGALQADSNGMVAMSWLLLGYLLQTTGELCLSPVGLSLVTKLSPVRVVSTIMGAWFLATAFSHILAAIIAGMTGVSDGGEGATVPPPLETVGVYGGVFGMIAVSAIASGVLVFLLSPLLTKMMQLEPGDASARGGH